MAFGRPSASNAARWAGVRLPAPAVVAGGLSALEGGPAALLELLGGVVAVGTPGPRPRTGRRCRGRGRAVRSAGTVRTGRPTSGPSSQSRPSQRSEPMTISMASSVDRLRSVSSMRRTNVPRDSGRTASCRARSVRCRRAASRSAPGRSGTGRVGRPVHGRRTAGVLSHRRPPRSRGPRCPPTSTSTTSPTDTGADAGRRPGHDHVARQEGHDLRDVLDQLAGPKVSCDVRPAGGPRRSPGISTATSVGSNSVSIHGPSGQNPSNPFARVHWPSFLCRSRAVTSFPHV